MKVKADDNKDDRDPVKAAGSVKQATFGMLLRHRLQSSFHPNVLPSQCEAVDIRHAIAVWLQSGLHPNVLHSHFEAYDIRHAVAVFSVQSR